MTSFLGINQQNDKKLAQGVYFIEATKDNRKTSSSFIKN